MKKSEVAKLVSMLAASYPSAKVGKQTSEVYEDMLIDLDFDVAQRAVAKLIATSEWMPTIAKIREACALIHGPTRTGAEAWQDALEQVRAVGWCGTPQFADPMVAQALRLFGSWRQFCSSPGDDAPGRARFIEYYDTLARRAAVDRQVPQMTGTDGGRRMR